MQRQLDRFFHRIAISDLTIYIVILTALVTAADAYGVLPGLGHLDGGTLARGEWWNVLFYPFNLGTGPGLRGMLFLLLQLYILWAFGTMLEGMMGHARYTAYVLLTIVSLTVVTLLSPVRVNPYYLDLAILLGCAYLQPNLEILLFFILPVKLKWVAIAFGGLAVGGSVLLAVTAGSLWPLLTPVAGLIGFILFFGIGAIRGTAMRVDSKRRLKKFEPTSSSIHRCAVCGLTENEDPHMDFRYCVDCADHEYCSEHLHAHQHQH